MSTCGGAATIVRALIDDGDDAYSLDAMGIDGDAILANAIEPVKIVDSAFCSGALSACILAAACCASFASLALDRLLFFFFDFDGKIRTHRRERT